MTLELPRLVGEDAQPAGNRRPLVICGIGYATSRHVVSRLRCFAERGHKVYLISEMHAGHDLAGITQLVPELPDKIRHAAWFKAVRSGSRTLLRLNIDHLWRFPAFIRLLRSIEPDIVHVHFAYSYFAWLAGIAGVHPLVVTVMGGDILFDEQGSPTRLGKLMTLNLLQTADFITSKSHHLTGVLERLLGGLGHRIERVTWGIPVRNFKPVDPEPLRRELGIGKGTRVVLSPRILQRLYCVHDIVEAMPAVLDACGDVVLLVTEYGADPDYKREIAQRIANLGLGGQVRFVGAVPHDRMPQFYSLADVSVGIPTSDGLPQSLLEGMACNVANVLRRLERYEEIVRHGDSAYLIDGSIESVAAGIITLLQDEALRGRIQRTARAVVEREGDLDLEAGRVEEAYYRLVARCRRTTIDWRQPWRVWRSMRRFGGALGDGY